MKRRIIKVLLYLIGTFCIVYPLCAKFITFRNQTKSIYDYKKELAQMEQAELENKIKKADEFNKDNSTESMIVDPNDVGNPNEAISTYSFLELGEMLGYVEIPKINVNMPIYEGVTIENLSKGVAHMEETSLPNGENNTHSVLAGHTGITNAIIFDDLDVLEINDEFYITFVNQKSKYKIVDKRIVLPTETSSLKIEDGRCLVTLVTCTPKSVNTHRLLITGEKVLDEKVIAGQEVQPEGLPVAIEEPKEKSEIDIIISFIKRNIKYFIIIIVFIILVIIIEIIGKLKNKKGEK